MDPRYLATMISKGDVGFFYTEFDPRSIINDDDETYNFKVNEHARSLMGALNLLPEADLASIKLEDKIKAYKGEIDKQLSLIAQPLLTRQSVCAKTYLDMLLSENTIRSYLSKPTKEEISVHATQLSNESVSIYARITIALLELPTHRDDKDIETKLDNLNKLLSHLLLVNGADSTEYCEFVECVRKYDGHFKDFIESTLGIPGLQDKGLRKSSYENSFRKLRDKLMPKQSKRALEPVDGEASPMPPAKRYKPSSSNLQDEVTRLMDENRALREQKEAMASSIANLQQQLQQKTGEASQHYESFQDAHKNWQDYMLRAEQLGAKTSSLQHTIDDRDQHIKALKSQIAEHASTLADSQRRVSESESALQETRTYVTVLRQYSASLYRQIISQASSNVVRDPNQDDPRIQAISAAQTSGPAPLQQQRVPAPVHSAANGVSGPVIHRSLRGPIYYYNGRPVGGSADAAAAPEASVQGSQSRPGEIRPRISIFNSGRLVRGSADTAGQAQTQNPTSWTNQS